MQRAWNQDPMPEFVEPQGPEPTQFKRPPDFPYVDSSPAKRIKQTREELVALRKVEKEREEAQNRAEREKREAEKALEKQQEKEQREAEKKLERERKEADRKAERERKKAQREAERLAEKKRKEAERLAEKERKEAEKVAEKERKEAEKAAEKQRREAERSAKKQRKLKAQPRINVFFKKSEAAPVEARNGAQQEADDDADASTDYRREFLPFHTKMDGRLFSTVCNCAPAEEQLNQDPVEWLKSLPRPDAPSRLSTTQFRSQLALAQESLQVAALLAQLRMRRLQFSRLSGRHIENPKAPVNEEFRPPYVGTTRDLDKDTKAQLVADPCRTDADPAVNYEYDSEAEWDHEDGDDLRDEDGDDSDEDTVDGEEMTGFLSTDEDDPTSSRRNIVGPLTPLVIWSQIELAKFSVQFVADAPMDPMNPFGESKSAPPAVGSSASAKTPAESGQEDVVTMVQAKVGFDPLKQCMMMVNGNQANKTLLIELMKQQLPSATEKEIRSVLDKCAERVGKKKAEKRWIVRPDACSLFEIERTPLLPTSTKAESNPPSPSRD